MRNTPVESLRYELIFMFWVGGGESAYREYSACGCSSVLPKRNKAI